VKLVLKGEPHRHAARRLVRDCLINEVTLIAPPLFESEVDTVIFKRITDGKLSLVEGKKALVGLERIPVQLLAHAHLRQRARELAEQFSLSMVYDATYAALAEVRGCAFWTADKEFYDTVKGALGFVKHLPDYP
jgi:predicted nucleic acid-binding protein